MAAPLILPKRYSRGFDFHGVGQPNADVKVSPAFDQDIVYALHAPAKRDLVTDRAPTLNNDASIQNRPHGVAWRLVGGAIDITDNATANFGSHPVLSGVQPFTYLWHGVVEDIGGTGSNLRFAGTSNDTGYLFRTINMGTNLLLFLNSVTPTAQADRIIAALATQYIGKLTTIVFKFSGLNVSLESIVKIHGNRVQHDFSNEIPTGGSYQDSDYFLNSNLNAIVTTYFASTTTRALSTAEMYQWAHNPYMYLEPKTPAIYYRKEERITAEAGEYIIDGQDANLLLNPLFSAEAGSYSITGQDVNLLHDQIMSAEAGSYSIAGFDAILAQNLVLMAEAGTYTITGGDADLSIPWTLQTNSIGEWTKKDGGI